MAIFSIGVDIGTANTRVAIWQDDKVQIIPDIHGGNSFPSSVVLDAPDQARLAGLKTRIRKSPKLLLESLDGNLDLEERRSDHSERRQKSKTERVMLSSVEAVAMILDRVVENVAAYFQSRPESMRVCATLSVPAFFNEQQRQAFRDAAKIVDIHILSIITTPSAICFARAHKSGNTIEGDEWQCLALDMGAGFFHAGVATIQSEVVEMKATYDQKLGGNDLDDGLYCHVEGRANEMGMFIDSNSPASRRLRSACQKAIIELSFKEESHILLKSLVDEKTLDIIIDRAIFAVVAKPILSETLQAIDDILQRSGIRKDQVQDIIATGGCSKIPLLQHIWKKHVGNEPEFRISEDDEVTGCALHAALIKHAPTSEQCSHNISDLIENMPLSVGVGLSSGECHTMIPRDSMIMEKHSESFIWDTSLGLVYDPKLPRLDGVDPTDTTETKDFDEAIRFYQGRHKQCQENLFLMKVDLTDILSKSSGLKRQKIGIEIIWEEVNKLDVLVTSDSDLPVSRKLDVYEIGLTQHELKGLRASLSRSKAEEARRWNARYDELATTGSLQSSPWQHQEVIGPEQPRLGFYRNQDPVNATSWSATHQAHHVHLSDDSAADLPMKLTTELNSMFSGLGRGKKGIYTDANFERVSAYLRNTGPASWSTMPRLYTALVLINGVGAMDDFLRKGMNDMCFPFSKDTLPATLSPTMKSAFLGIQETVYSESKSWDVGHGKHVYFSKDDPKPFKRIAYLGKGGYATVDKVIHQLDLKEYARKLFIRVRGWSNECEKSFHNEVKVLRQVNHFHCIKLINTYSDPKHFALLMEPAGECNLLQYYEVAQNDRDKLSLLRGFLGCLASGVRYLHDSKIRHKDIKPQNIIIKDDRVYITDFGIAYLWETFAGATTTADSGKTMTYAAPEVVKMKPRNAATDIWSLGCIFFEIATILCGRSIKDLKAHFMEKTSSDAYYLNIKHLSTWADKLRSGSMADEVELPWTIALQALRKKAEQRPTAATLAEKIVKETSSKGVNFCGECYLDEDASMSESEGNCGYAEGPEYPEQAYEYQEPVYGLT